MKQLFLLFFLALSIQALSEVRLPQLVSNGMVLQRDTRLKIWGWAAPGEKVSIKFQQQTYRATAGLDQKWLIWLPALKAGGPYQMDITGSNHIVLRDILIGDVWFCAGQSNMVINMERVKENYMEEISKADYPEIRNFFIPTLADVTRLHEDLPPGKWMAATPKNVLEFGAAAYFFEKKIYGQYHVPIGIINASVGGTPIQAWMSEQGLSRFPEDTRRLLQLKDTVLLSRLMAVVPVKKKPQLDQGLIGTKTWYDTSYKPVDWYNFWLPGYWADQGVRGLNGVVWFRKEIDLPAGVDQQAAHLFMGRIVDSDQVYVNGILAGGTTYQYPPRRYELSAGLLKPGKNIIVVRVVNDAGKGGFVPDKPYYLAVADKKFDLRGEWQYKVGEVFKPVQGKTNNFSMQNEPAGLYNTMVAPAINFSIKGVLWYQGEANTFKPAAYQYLLPALIADWRKQWQQAELPFIYAQLPNFMEMQYSPSESLWAELRQGQLKTLSVPYTGMAVTIDAGEWNDIHPLNKKDVGERMALAAMKTAYGDLKTITSGPLYQTAVVKNNKIEVTFSETGSGLMAKGGTALTQFAIAGADHKFVWAHAVINGNKVVVWGDSINEPLYVRYAWADNPDGASLYNKEGLPASPFTTEDLTVLKESAVTGAVVDDKNKLRNPILSGFYPDPSICKSGADYYLVNSTFAYFPGIPVFHSKDLKNWKQVGNVISRPSQMNFMGDRVSRGLFAPAINYHNGLYYVTCTMIDRKGNFIVTAKDPAGPWSDPVWLPEVKGIDPSLFFEGDKTYIVYNSDAPDNKPLYEGHRTLRLFELDRDSLKVKGTEILLVNGGVDLGKKPIWIEGPHIYKREGYYYLMAAEGGTAVNHSEVVFRSRDVKGPYIPYDKNPILTQRDLDPNRERPITSTGHADLVEGPDGKTYAVFIATRPYQGDYYNIGRETFIAPVKWTEEGWPIINPDYREVQYHYAVDFPAVPQKGVLPMNGSFDYTLDFKNGLSSQFLFLRTQDQSWYSLTEKKDQLTINLLPETCMGVGNPAFIGKRQQHLVASASTEMDFKTVKTNEKSGLMIFQSEYNFYYLCKSASKAGAVIQLYKGNKSQQNMELVTEQPLSDAQGKIQLRIDINNDQCSFYYAATGKTWRLIKDKLDGKYLSTKEAGGFVGSLFALYATSSGEKSTNKTVFSWLKYSGKDL